MSKGNVWRRSTFCFRLFNELQARPVPIGCRHLFRLLDRKGTREELPSGLRMPAKLWKKGGYVR